MTNDIQQMEIVKAAKLFFANYFDFSGRASRGEFWWAYLAYFIASILVSIVDAVIGGILYGITGSDLLLTSGFLINILFLATFIGWISLTARRLQDNGRTGWWQLGYLSVIPTTIFWVSFAFAEGPILLFLSIIFTLATIVLYILILVWLIMPPTEDENRWGLNQLKYENQKYENQNKTSTGADPEDW